MANEQFGPLAGLIGTWQGNDGLDVSYSYEHKKITENPYTETATFNVVGDVDNGSQKLWVIDYTTAAKRKGQDSVFHTELGYWIWDPASQEVMRCFMVPRGSTILAGGKCAPDAKKFSLSARSGDEVFGVLSNPYLAKNARCVEYKLDCTIEGDTWTYEETTVLEMKATGSVMQHTDRNVLKRVK
ncbi:MAG: FABP family protein [Spirochaetaceae bacterium]|nr:FABP family protein [Myxococcales bacterium]MCB9725279.1 FABP family protein [Spirochaetaceae bacterium]